MSKRTQSEYDVTATVDSLSSAVMKALNEYGDYVAEVTKDAVEDVAETCRQEITRNSPSKSGAYARDWKKKRQYFTASEARWMVYNAKHYQLTHLLEYGHEKWIYGYYTGDRVQGKPHIRPAEQNAQKNLINQLKRNLS